MPRLTFKMPRLACELSRASSFKMPRLATATRKLAPRPIAIGWLHSPFVLGRLRQRATRRKSPATKPLVGRGCLSKQEGTFFRATAVEIARQPRIAPGVQDQGETLRRVIVKTA
jgi:hypothetical protein